MGEVNANQNAFLVTFIDSVSPDDITQGLSVLQGIFGALPKYLDGVVGIVNELSKVGYVFVSLAKHYLGHSQIHPIAKAAVVALSVTYNVCSIFTCDKCLSTMQLLKTHSQFHQDLLNLHEEMRNLVSDLIAIKDIIRVDLLRTIVIDIMKAIVEVSDYIRVLLSKRKIGQ